MTFGRPSMTSHLAPFPAPDGLNTNRLQDGTKEPSLMVFYYEAIKLYGILDMILADVYKAWGGRSCQDQPQTSTTTNLGTLETVLKVERELMVFKENLPSFLKWNSGEPSIPSGHDSNIAISRQINVLHARYAFYCCGFTGCLPSYLTFCLDTFISTFCYTARSLPNSTQSQTPLVDKRCKIISALPCLKNVSLHVSQLPSISRSSFERLIRLMRPMHGGTMGSVCHQSNPLSLLMILILPSPDVSTAAIILLMSISTPSMMDQSTMDKARDAWKDATAILESMATFCRSATNTLQFLQAAYHQTVPNDPVQAGVEADASGIPRDTSQSDIPYEHPNNDMTDFPVFDWEAFAENTAPGMDDLGFLTRFNFNDSLF